MQCNYLRCFARGGGGYKEDQDLLSSGSSGSFGQYTQRLLGCAVAREVFKLFIQMSGSAK